MRPLVEELVSKMVVIIDQVDVMASELLVLPTQRSVLLFQLEGVGISL